jgi:hypothetical protein
VNELDVQPRSLSGTRSDAAKLLISSRVPAAAMGIPKLRAFSHLCTAAVCRLSTRREAHGQQAVIDETKPFAFYPRDIDFVWLVALTCRLRLAI